MANRNIDHGLFVTEPGEQLSLSDNERSQFIAYEAAVNIINQLLKTINLSIFHDEDKKNPAQIHKKLEFYRQEIFRYHKELQQVYAQLIKDHKDVERSNKDRRFIIDFHKYVGSIFAYHNYFQTLTGLKSEGQRITETWDNISQGEDEIINNLLNIRQIIFSKDEFTEQMDVIEWKREKKTTTPIIKILNLAGDVKNIVCKVLHLDQKNQFILDFKPPYNLEALCPPEFILDWLENAASNSAKSHDEAKIQEPLQLKLIVRAQGENLVLQFIDNGGGLSTESFPIAMGNGEFVTSNGTGLALAQESLDANGGGRIELINRQQWDGERGAINILTVPLKKN